MIQLAISLERRLMRETVRHAGSLAEVAYYSGSMPPCCEDRATGEKIGVEPATEALVRAITEGHEPALPKGATYWRVLDNGALVVMQGDGK